VNGLEFPNCLNLEELAYEIDISMVELNIILQLRELLVQVYKESKKIISCPVS
jgi:hypothetical protein